MTRETKVGLVVASSFICLVGVVVASKLRPNDANASHTTEEQAQNFPKPTLPSPTEKKTVDAGVVPAKFPRGEVPELPMPKPSVDVPAPALSIPPVGEKVAKDGFPSPAPPNFEEEQKNVMAELQKQKNKPPEQVAFADPLPPPTVPGVPTPPPPAKESGPPPLPPPGLDSGPPTVSPLSIKPKSNSDGPPPPAPPFGGPPKIESSGPVPGAPTPSPAAPVDPGPFGGPAPPTPTPPAPVTPGPTNPGPTPPAPTPSAPIAPPTPFKDPAPPAPLGPGGDGPPPLVAPVPPVKPPSDLKPPISEPEAKNPFKKADPVPPLGSGAPAFGVPGGNTPGLPQVKNFNVQSVTTEPGDTSFTALSQRLFNTDKYGQALLQFNRDNNPLAGSGILQDPPRLEAGQKVFVPPTDILESRYGTLIGKGQVIRPMNVPITNGPSNPFGSGTSGNGPPPIGATPPPIGASVPIGSATPFGANPTSFGGGNNPPPIGTPTGPGALMVRTPATTPTTDVTKRYRVVSQGQHIIEIARQTLGDGSRWSEIYRLNPTLQPQNVIPGGTELKLPATAQIP